ncbi:MAG: sugar phosphate nucleotidyltransferase, partial [Paludibacteraceae bacterium]|nr:sugar phosphate nucleotidyltransferase [Paludibacteraceae bacterium]
MITEAIILAGGFGTRLKHVLGNIPKPMAPVDGRPFLAYLFERLRGIGITHVILSTGYMHEKVQEYFGDSYRDITISYAQETTPLFTGGAIALAST